MRRAAFMAIATGLLAGGAWVYGQQDRLASGRGNVALSLFPADTLRRHAHA
jgi:hypothetical protein